MSHKFYYKYNVVLIKLFPQIGGKNAFYCDFTTKISSIFIFKGKMTVKGSGCLKGSF